MEKQGIWPIKWKKLKLNNAEIWKKILKIILAQSKHLYIPQSINKIISNSNYKSLSIIIQINFKNWYIYITLKVQDNFELKIIALLDSVAYQNCIKEISIPS